MPTVKKWAITSFKKNTCTFTWTISNYSYLSKSSWEKIESPTFVSKGKEWCLFIRPSSQDTSEKYLSLYLECKSSSNVKEFQVQGLSFSILNNENKELMKKEVKSVDKMKAGTSTGDDEFLKSENPNDLLSNGDLKLFCEFSVVIDHLNISSNDLGTSPRVSNFA